jgi:hypothetical protein
MSDDDTPKDQDGFSPRNFLRARRPERFSDSVTTERPALDRTTLEYHLDTLTSRSQETLFEEFARQLVQREVCPNLLPHTGPTGGGDSKVDSETFPVSDVISAAWFVGSDGQAGRERWAFAMSAKKEWMSKVRTDISSLASTDRGYVKAFFISNQYIRDKQRATEEDALSKKHGLEVRIFDRTWVLDRVFSSHHEQLAITELAIKVPSISEVRKGPLDIQRERDLEDVELRIKTALQGSPTPALVDDCLEAALLARNLERPRTEIDGRFLRSQRISLEHGTRHQQVLAFYEHAWTTFWWHEDLQEFVRLYDEVESRAQDTHNVADAELLSNLWTLLATARRREDLSDDVAQLERRTTTIRATVETLAKEEDRPSIALQARAMLAWMDLQVALPEHPDGPFGELRKIVEETKGLIGFPITRLTQLVTELSEFFVGSAAFEELFETLVEAMATRQGEVAGARMLLKLGAQQLDADRPYEAIRTLGRALSNLYKHESRKDMVRALFLCAAAYERVELLWVARGTLLNAASVATNEWWTHSEITLAQRNCYNRLKWVELQLGRVPHLLAWHEVDVATRVLLTAEGYAKERLSYGEPDFDMILGILLLRSDVWQLKQLETLPNCLHRLQLHGSALALVFALGHSEEIQEGGDDVVVKDMHRAFSSLAKQPAGNDLPDAPSLHSERTQTLKSIILGCALEVTADNTSPCVELAESLLAAVEGLLATSVLEGIMPHVPLLRVRVRKSDLTSFPFLFEIAETDGFPVIEIRCAPFEPHGLKIDQQRALKDALANVVFELLGRGFFIESEATLTRVFADERGLQRAIEFTGSFGTVRNSLGPSPKTSIGDWATSSQTRFELRRAEEWDAEDRLQARQAAQAAATRRIVEPPRGTWPAGAEPPGLAGIKHSDISFESIIRESLWNRARWRAIGWAAAPGVPPWMVLGFENQQPAAEILTQLVQDVGRDDPRNRLRITIVRGISAKRPLHYRVLIGSNVDPKVWKKLGGVMFRVHTMEPTSSVNLDRFLASYEQTGKYLVGIGVVDPAHPRPPVPMRHGYVLKRDLQIRHAWELGINDIDSSGVFPDDDVLIPPEHSEDAPVLELLKWKAEKSRSLDWVLQGRRKNTSRTSKKRKGNKRDKPKRPGAKGKRRRR